MQIRARLVQWCIVPCCLLSCCLVPPAGLAQVWVEDTYEDFADGHLDASGQNIYVARDGSVRTIHRFDLNQDGFVDLVFNSTHDRYSRIPATLATISAEGTVTTSPVAVEGSQQAVLGDLNKDGHADAVFCPNPSNVQGQRRLVTIIWGGEDGWPAHRSHAALPANGARSIALADLNADSWPDIVVLNGEAWLPAQPAGSVVRVYWGGPDGFELSRRREAGVSGGLSIASRDFDRDGAADLAVLSADGSLQLFWAESSGQLADRTSIPIPAESARCLTVADANNDGELDLIVGTERGMLHFVWGGGGRKWGRVESIQAHPASHIAAGDLDADRKTDLVLTHFVTTAAGGGEVSGGTAEGAVRVLWGSARGFSPDESLRLAVSWAKATAIGDLNGDELPDLAVAVHQGAQHTSADSVIFRGSGKRELRRLEGPLPTTGAADVAIAPPEPTLPARAVFCNSLGETLREEVPLQVYWGGADGFKEDRRWEIPFASGYESTAADLNCDGFVDLIELNSGHAGELAKLNPHLGVNIFWGSADGFDLEKRRTVLRENNLGTSNVADLNRDGFLDLVLGQFAPAGSSPTQELIIYYGAADGLDRSRRVAIPSPGRSIGTVLADFDRDQWLDVAVACYESHVARVFWGGKNGFDESRQANLPVHAAIDAETADLNADGFLDLIVGSYADRLSGQHDLGTTIFWGGRERFHASRAQWLPGSTPIGHCVADFDADGHLDLFTPNYHANGTRESLPAYLYWGSEKGFDTRRRTTLICDSSDDALAADFDHDGKLDLAVVCHATDATHATNSKVFYNDGNRFSHPQVTLLPTHGPHWMWGEDMGHIYHRRWEQTYRSSVFRWEPGARAGRLQATAMVPDGATLTFTIRSASSERELPGQPWRKLDAGQFTLNPADRALEYQALLKSDNGDRYPVLERVVVTLEQ